MEEPENGIHPERIPAIIELLQDLTTNTQDQDPNGARTQLRQVIINTHSPSVVMQVPEDSLVMAESVQLRADNTSFSVLRLRGLAGTWRDKQGTPEPISKGRLLAYLNPVSQISGDSWDAVSNGRASFDRRRPRRVVDRDDLRQYKIPFSELAG